MRTMEVNRIIHADALEELKKLPTNSIDLTVTSPPYDDLREYGSHNKFDFCDIAQELYRVTKEGGVVVWVVGDATVNGSETGTSFRQALYFKDECGFNLHDTMIYEKSGCGACGSEKAYIQNFEYMFVLVKGNIKTYNLLFDRKNKGGIGVARANEKRDEFNADNERQYRKIRQTSYGKRFNVWRYNQTSVSDKLHFEHPAPFPEQLAEDHIKSWSNEGDLVLDPFLGSGTTAKMALKLNRNFIGIEINKKYVELAEKRIRPYLEQERLEKWL